MDWIDDLSAHTTRIKIDNTKKYILLVNPHFSKGQKFYRSLIKNLKLNTYKGYTVEAVGMCNLYGAIILDKIQHHLKKQGNEVKLRFNNTYSLYRLIVKFKGE